MGGGKVFAFLEREPLLQGMVALREDDDGDDDVVET